jgi:8-oxo-dGTP diphosphatase
VKGEGIQRPLVGVGVMVWHERRVLLGLRRGAHGDGCWSFPGGHLEFGEDFATCAAREVLEESGLVVEGLRVASVTNDVFIDEARHYVTVFLQGVSCSADARRCEPEKCERWGWFDWSSLPTPLFLPIRHLIEGGFAPR